MMEFLQHNTTFWISCSFVIFVLLAFKFGRSTVTGALDKKIETIKTDISNAERLKNEARALLAEFQQKQHDAEKEAATIIANATASAKVIQSQAETALADTMARREAQLQDRLHRLEEQAIAQIQNHAADLALKAATEIVSRTMDEKTNARLIDQSIASVTKNIN